MSIYSEARATLMASLVSSGPNTIHPETLASLISELTDAVLNEMLADESVASALATTVGGKLDKASNLSDIPNPDTALGNLGGTTAGKAVFQAANYAAIRTLLSLGTAALLDTGTTAGKAVVLDGSARLPAVDGSQLTNLSSGTSAASLTQARQGVSSTLYISPLTLAQTVGPDLREIQVMLSELKGDRINLPDGWFDPLSDTSDLGTTTNCDTSVAGKITPSYGTKTVFLTSGTSWTVPSDYVSGTVECIGAGGGGAAGTTNVSTGGGGGGGGYSKITGLSLTPGASVAYAIGAAGSAGVGSGSAGGVGGDTYFNGASFGASSVGAKGGSGGSTSAGGAGGAAGSGVGTTKNTGGAGAYSTSSGNAAGGGGGAAGKQGNGGAGGAVSGSSSGGGGGGGSGGGASGTVGANGIGPSSGSTGGAGGNNAAGSGGGAANTAGTAGGGGGGGNSGTAGGAGGAGSDYTATAGGTAGPGGGGGGGGGAANSSAAGGAGGAYGGGGGGGSCGGGTSSSGGAGGGGLIVITYQSSALPQNLTIISNAFTAAAAPARVRALLQLKPIDAITINTDVIMSVSRDGGTTWTAATLAAETSLADGTTLYVHDGLDISGQPSGTSMKAKVVSANGKNFEVNGLGEKWAA